MPMIVMVIVIDFMNNIKKELCVSYNAQHTACEFFFLTNTFFSSWSLQCIFHENGEGKQKKIYLDNSQVGCHHHRHWPNWCVRSLLSLIMNELQNKLWISAKWFLEASVNCDFDEFFFHLPALMDRSLYRKEKSVK